MQDFCKVVLRWDLATYYLEPLYPNVTQNRSLLAAGVSLYPHVIFRDVGLSDRLRSDISKHGRSLVIQWVPQSGRSMQKRKH